MATNWTFDHEPEGGSPDQDHDRRLTVRYAGDDPVGTGMSPGQAEPSPYVPVGTGQDRLNVDRKRTFDHGRYNALSWPAFLCALLSLALVAGILIVDCLLDPESDLLEASTRITEGAAFPVELLHRLVGHAAAAEVPA